jgi:hypothetical protein
MALGLTHPLTEMSTRNISWAVKVRRADIFATFIYRLSSNLGTSNSWNPQALSRSVMGLLCLYLSDAQGHRCDIKTAVLTIFTAMTCNLPAVVSQQQQLERIHYSFNAR